MRRNAAIAGALALMSCKQEPSFDERYDAAQDRIEGMARDIDGDLKKAEPSDAVGTESIPTGGAAETDESSSAIR